MMDNAPSKPDMRSLTEVEAAGLYEDLALPPGKGRPYTVTNTVVTVDGKTTFEGRSTPIGSRFDRLVMRRIRAAADAVILGAGSLRAEEIEFRLPPALLAVRPSRGLAPRQTVVIITAQGDLPLHRRLFSQPSPDVEPVILTTERARALVERLTGGRMRVVAAGNERVDLTAAMTALSRHEGIRHAVLEGGPSLNAAMLAAGLVDEVMLTVAPKVLGGPALTMVAGPNPLPGGLQHLALVSAYAYADDLFLRYRIVR